jgi:DNA repair ATPase RecN
MSDKEFLIEKFEEKDKTHTQVLELDENAKTNEIIRLLGGNSNDEFAKKHAEELLKQSKEYKNTL